MLSVKEAVPLNISVGPKVRKPVYAIQVAIALQVASADLAQTVPFPDNTATIKMVPVARITVQADVQPRQKQA
jgi:hypothetical protein